MRESVKSVLALVAIVCFGGSFFFWMMNGREAKDLETTSRIFRYVLPIVGLITLAILLKIHYRKDDVPDFLGQNFKNYFNRNGFCFAVNVIDKGGICFFEIYYQNQFERPCHGIVALRPSRGFFLDRTKMDTIIVKVDCGPAEFGVARVAVPIPLKIQGRRHSFEVGASAKYPEGKGKRLRFKDGLLIRADTNFSDVTGKAMMVAGALVGHIVVTRPASVKILMPENVDSEIPLRSDLEPETFWKLGDPLAEAAQG